MLVNQESLGAWESELLKTAPVTQMTSLTGRQCPNLTEKLTEGLKINKLITLRFLKNDSRSNNGID